MVVNVIAIFIPIVFLVGLFGAIGLNIYYKYKTQTVMSERVPLESLGEWYKIEAQAKSMRSHGAALRWGGFFSGAGLGLAIGCVILLCGNFNYTTEPYYILMIIALTVFCGGVGMIGAYFLEKKLNKKAPAQNHSS